MGSVVDKCITCRETEGKVKRLIGEMEQLSAEM